MVEVNIAHLEGHRQHPAILQAFSAKSELALSLVLQDLQLDFDLADFQVFAVNAILIGHSVISVIPTGSGKSLVIYLVALALPKMIGVENTMVVVGKYCKSWLVLHLLLVRHAPIHVA